MRSDCAAFATDAELQKVKEQLGAGELHALARAGLHTLMASSAMRPLAAIACLCLRRARSCAGAELHVGAGQTLRLAEGRDRCRGSR